MTKQKLKRIYSLCFTSWSKQKRKRIYQKARMHRYRGLSGRLHNCIKK